MRVGVDREQAADLDGQPQQVIGRVLAFWPAVDLHRDAVVAAGGEHRLRVELRLRAAAADDYASGAVAQHVGMRVADRGDHPRRHRHRRHPQLGVHAGDHHVQPPEKLVRLIQRAVLEDVDLDAGQDPERRQGRVQLPDQLELGTEPVSGQPAGHGEPGRMVGERHPFVAQVARGQRHLQRRAAAVGPVRVHVAVTPHRGAQRGRRGRRPAAEQPGQVLRVLTGRRLRDHLRGRLADPGQLPQRPGPHPVGQLGRAQPGDDLGGAPERPDPVRRRAGTFELERDLPQRPYRIHTGQLTSR